jgi:hypothetical protein
VLLDGCFRVSDASLAAFVASAPGLTHVALKNSHKVGPLAVAALASAGGLLSLALERCPAVDDAALAAIAGRLLTALRLDGCEMVSDDGVRPSLSIVSHLLPLTHIAPIPDSSCVPFWREVASIWSYCTFEGVSTWPTPPSSSIIPSLIPGCDA